MEKSALSPLLYVPLEIRDEKGNLIKTVTLSHPLSMTGLATGLGGAILGGMAGNLVGKNLFEGANTFSTGIGAMAGLNGGYALGDKLEKLFTKKSALDEYSLPWALEVSPEDSFGAISKEDQDKIYEEWRKNPSKEKMNDIIKKFSRLLNSEISRYQGTLEPRVMASYAKKYLADAVKSYNPKSDVMLTTHIVHGLRQLHRLNYKNVQGLKTPEDIQQKIKSYLTARGEIFENTGKDPQDTDIAKYMGISKNNVKRIREQIKVEIPSKAMSYAPTFYEQDPDEDMVDFVYHDLNPTHKKIFEYKTGYGGSNVLSGKDIAKKLGLSPVRVTQISNDIVNKIKKMQGEI